MPLINILQTIAAEEGIKLTEPSAKAKLIRDVNKSARSIYKIDDLSYALYEQVFQIDEEQQQFTLPWYVGSIRGCRRLDSGEKQTLTDMRPRYQGRAWKQSRNDIRVKNEVPNKRDIVNASILTFTLSFAETFEVKVTVQGSVANRSMVTETITIPIGSLTASSINSFTEFLGPRAISKDVITTSDVVVTDASGNVIAEIPNILDRSRYLLCQKHDNDEPTGTGTECYEILFKHLYVPMENNNDHFIIPGEEWEDTIILWTQSRIRGRSMDQNILASAATLRTEALIEIQNKVHEDTGGIEKTLEFGRNRFQDAFTLTTRRSRFTDYHYNK